MKRFAVILVLVGSFLFTQTAAADLVTNGGFETGNFTGWTRSGNWADSGIAPAFVHSGQYAVSLGPVGTLGFLSQTLATTPGSFYDISFWLYCQPGIPNVFGMNWGSDTIFDQVNIPGQGYTEYHFTTLASASSTELTFGFRDDPGHWFLDDVSVNLNVSENPVLSAILPPLSNLDPVGSPYAVPLPPSALLLASSLLGIVVWRRL